MTATNRSMALSLATSLPLEVFANIMEYLDMQERCKITRVCRQWHQYLQSPFCWRNIIIPDAENDGNDQIQIQPQMFDPFSALLKVIRTTSNTVRHARLAQMPTLHLILGAASLAKANMQSLSTLHIYHKPSENDNKEELIKACEVIEGKELTDGLSPVQRRDWVLMNLLFNPIGRNGLTVALCAELCELSISGCSDGVGLWNGILPMCLKILFLDFQVSTPESDEPFRFYIQTSLTKLIMRQTQGHLPTIVLDDIQAAAPHLQSLYLEGFLIEDKLGIDSVESDGAIPWGLNAMQHLQELVMIFCSFFASCPPPSSLIKLGVIDTSLEDLSWLRWQGAKLGRLEAIHLERLERVDEDDGCWFIDPAAYALTLLDSSMETPLRCPYLGVPASLFPSIPLRSLSVSLYSQSFSERAIAHTSFFDFINAYGSGLRRLQVADLRLTDVHTIQSILITCSYLESFTVLRPGNLVDTDLKALVIEHSPPHLKEIRIWGCSLNRVHIEATMNECTARGIRFEWLPSRGNRKQDWQAPIYNWRAPAKTGPDVFDHTHNEYLNQLYDQSPPPGADPTSSSYDPKQRIQRFSVYDLSDDDLCLEELDME